MADYRTIITVTGQTKLADAIVGPALTLQTMAVGDANGVGYDPDEAQAALVNPVYTANVDGVETLAGGVIVVEMTVPANEGGFHVREAGVFDDAGDLIAIARIADRYKPLPASGQADELTVRMKLDVGNVGNVNWVVDLARKAKIDGQLRPDFRSVASGANDPPGAPAPGQTWIVGVAPTGAWVGHENELAEWSGTGWTFAEPTPWMLVGLSDRTDWRWDHALGQPAWVRWLASKTMPGPVRIATIAEALAGDAPDIAVDPIALRAGARSFATDILTNPGAGTWTVPSDIYQIEVEAVGGGGGGGGAQNSAGWNGGGGGGAGGATAIVSIAVTPGQIIAYVIGDEGASGTPSASAAAGGTTTFAGIVSAGGGQGGLTADGGTTAGGTATGGDINITGSDGGTSILMEGNQNKGGSGAGSPYGSGGAGSATGVGNDAKGHGAGGGGGGGGGVTNAGVNGGRGSPGLIIIRY
ncbi:MAG: phage tail protein [Roseitalea sp.]|nr:phage tail protein [Roseitalea sp.]MBO6950979.1 phage tail protein [Rhizobiaceae bacterium]MBO6591034.1 phage tail protein [Roseitalea sp.]MBO6599708.1 phage tail protein [Roseitalea sp.]MBO6611464.1 phage tail protein [Roseitalea sp.]